MGKIAKGVLKLVGVDMDGNKKAAQEQAKAIRDSTAVASKDALLAAQAAQSSIENAQALAKASKDASDLLGKPLESANVELGLDDEEEGDALLGGKRRTRAAYQAAGRSGSGLIV